jgi:hypothetical protein
MQKVEPAVEYSIGLLENPNAICHPQNHANLSSAIDGLRLLAGEALARGVTIIGNEIYATAGVECVSTGHCHDI